MTNSIKTSVSGFSQSDEEKFKKVFRFSRFRRRLYTYCPNVLNGRIDILIVNGDTEKDENVILTKYPNVVIVVAKKKRSLKKLDYRISGNLSSSKILRTLDRIGIEDRKPKCRRKAKSFFAPPLLKGGKKVDEALFSAKEKSKNKLSTVVRDPVFDVLVVDDSPSMQKMLELEFAQTTMVTQVSLAGTGERALECIAERSYDFIFLDVMMPGIDGYETCSRIRKYPEMKKTPIIMLSAKTSPLDEVKGIMAGCTTYLTKPIKHEEFQRVVGRILRWLTDYKTAELSCDVTPK
ncbi:MAG: response regulator [Methylococcales bacterium]